VAFGVLIMICVVSGFLHSTGLAVVLGPLTSIQVHVGSALLAAPLAVWHVASRRVRIHRTDLDRRNLLRAATLIGASAAAYAATESALRWSGGLGGRRRFTGSYPVGDGDVPVTQWLTDGVPIIRPQEWSLVVRTLAGERTYGYEDLATTHDRLTATLDCTGGWFTEQEWEGLTVDRLLPHGTAARSIEVVSATGYARRFPVSDASHLLLAVRMRGRPLTRGHGFPVRLVAPGRRGFWWVKWVSRIELSSAPWWWQPPFPLQ
jgi:DMSO/TMAO reductase YedYZ molybdopterin-dependent catalytic subunit